MELEKEALEIIKEWSDKTKLKVEFTNKGIKVIPKYERKGIYVKELDDLDNDLPIVNEALVNYFINGTMPEETVNKCNELIKFQKVVKISSNYKMGWHNGEFLKDKTFRLFASKNPNDTYMGKVKYEGATIEKFGDTPDKCFIDNTNVKGKEVPANLDKRWYINLAYKRLGDYGVSLNDDSLF